MDSLELTTLLLWTLLVSGVGVLAFCVYQMVQIEREGQEWRRKQRRRGEDRGGTPEYRPPTPAPTAGEVGWDYVKGPAFDCPRCGPVKENQCGSTIMAFASVEFGDQYPPHGPDDPCLRHSPP